MKDVVKVVFEMPREEFATLKYLCIKKRLAIKDVMGNAAKDIVQQLLEEKPQKDTLLK